MALVESCRIKYNSKMSRRPDETPLMADGQATSEPGCRQSFSPVVVLSRAGIQNSLMESSLVHQCMVNM